MTTPSEIFAEVLAVHAAHEAFDKEMISNRHDPWAVAEKLARPDAVSFLVGVLERGGENEVYYAAHALEKLGSSGRAASAALENRGQRVALFAVDEPRARKLGLHRSRESVRHDYTSRAAIARYVVESRDAARIAAHFAGLLDDDDDDVVLFALDANNYLDGSGLCNVAQHSPASVPLASVRACLTHSTSTVRSRAAGILAALHLPEDAQAVLAMRTIDASPWIAGDWLGSLPDSHRLLATADIKEVFEIVRRRRCAGLITDASAIRERLRDALGVHNDWRVIGHAARTVAELGDAELLDAVVDGFSVDDTYSHFNDMCYALRAFGNAGLEAARRGKARWTRVTQLGWMVDDLARPIVRQLLDLREADARFVAGDLEPGVFVDEGAYGAYAATLLREPRNKHAAVQCAWIDRGFGTPITHSRLQWLDALGVSEDLLAELATRPPAIVPNDRSGHRHAANPNAELAATAELAGLFGVAANYALLDEQEGLRERARAHIARLA
jgi:hypothetical protein